MRYTICLLVIATMTVLTSAGCQTMTGPKFEARTTEQFWMDGFSFEKSVAVDTKGSSEKLIDIRPSKLPYTGTISEMKAQDRWLRIFEALLKAVRAECKGEPKELPQISADRLDYSDVNDSKEVPRYGQARFVCYEN